ncbi:MAG: phosphoribosylformylglycinamidine cyclo-ligase [Anaerovoracaceae bacterium]|jgi:phosphoribosylformylglycinamidine cyclo-ligase
MKSFSELYKESGVDITAGYEAVSLMKKHIARTVTKGVLGDIGGFGGLFELDLTDIKEPVLVSGTDGVGTKLKIAFLMDKHDTIGIDCVAMCVNDIVCSGAKPLIFLDYLAVGVNRPEKVAKIVSGIAEGCVQAGCALVGGETAEMPGFYGPEEYDLAGFAVGIADKCKLIDSQSVKPGDVIIGLPSSGIHSNGFSLVRKVLDVENQPLSRYMDELSCTLGEALLTPTRIYVKPVLSLLSQIKVKGICHITGGGFYENIPRILPANCAAKIDYEALTVPPIFHLLQKAGNIPVREMFNVFNMGTGMCIITNPADADKAIQCLNGYFEKEAAASAASNEPFEKKSSVSIANEQFENESAASAGSEQIKNESDISADIEQLDNRSSSRSETATIIGEIVPGEKEVIMC